MKPACNTSAAPLFIPLKRQYFEAFERGEKSAEWRPYGPRWNERTCRPGRPVVLSLGYGKALRLRGVIVRLDVCSMDMASPAFREIYGARFGWAAKISIELDRLIKPPSNAAEAAECCSNRLPGRSLA